MKANWKRSQEAPHLGRVAFEKYKVRASLEEELTKKAQEFDDRRWEELNAYATAVDATIMMTLHNRYHFTARVLRETMTWGNILGAILILGSALYSELPTKEKAKSVS